MLGDPIELKLRCAAEELANVLDDVAQGLVALGSGCSLRSLSFSLNHDFAEPLQLGANFCLAALA